MAELILEESARLSNEMLGVLGGVHLENGRFAFALNAALNPDELAEVADQIGVYQLVSLAELPERVNSLPPNDGTPSASNRTLGSRWQRRAAHPSR